MKKKLYHRRFSLPNFGTGNSEEKKASLLDISIVSSDKIPKFSFYTKCAICMSKGDHV